MIHVTFWKINIARFADRKKTFWGLPSRHKFQIMLVVRKLPQKLIVAGLSIILISKSHMFRVMFCTCAWFKLETCQNTKVSVLQPPANIALGFASGNLHRFSGTDLLWQSSCRHRGPLVARTRVSTLIFFLNTPFCPESCVSSCNSHYISSFLPNI